ncbi:MAG: hypothetical protein V3U84_07260 [Thiotrichaceae bacterium]
MKKPLKQAIQEQLNSVSLEKGQLDTLMQMQREDVSSSSAMPITRPTAISAKRAFRPWVAATAAMLLVFVMGALWVSFTTISDTAPDTTQNTISLAMIQKIANEVAGNHLKMKPMEVKTAAIGEIQSYFTELDFMPQQSRQIDGITQITLAGGRYCSIQGSTAAQLRYKESDGSYVTLFETHYSPELFKHLPDIDKGEKPIVTYARGIKVTMWVEHGLLMVSTEKPK